MSHPYAANYFPPIPALPVWVAYPGAARPTSGCAAFYFPHRPLRLVRTQMFTWSAAPILL